MVGEGGGQGRRMALDKIEKARRKRHGVAVKKGLKSAKQQRKVVKTATLALRKTTKGAIVQRLFDPKAPKAVAAKTQ